MTACYSLAVRFDRMGVSRGSSGVWQLYCSRLNRRAVLAVPSSSPVEFGGWEHPVLLLREQRDMC